MYSTPSAWCGPCPDTQMPGVAQYIESIVPGAGHVQTPSAWYGPFPDTHCLVRACPDTQCLVRAMSMTPSAWCGPCPDTQCLVRPMSKRELMSRHPVCCGNIQQVGTAQSTYNGGSCPHFVSNYYPSNSLTSCNVIA